MKISEAIDIAKHLKKAILIAGEGNLQANYTEIQLVKALIAFYDATGDTPISNDDLTKVKRQLTAANARLARYEKREGSGNE